MYVCMYVCRNRSGYLQVEVVRALGVDELAQDVVHIGAYQNILRAELVDILLPHIHTYISYYSININMHILILCFQ